MTTLKSDRGYDMISLKQVQTVSMRFIFEDVFFASKKHVGIHMVGCTFPSLSRIDKL